MAIDKITASGLGDGGVSTVDIADGAVTAAKLDAAAVTSTAVSDSNNTSTGAFDIPSGTTAQRPGSPNAGYTRFNTDLVAMENYDGTSWLKVSSVVAVLNSVGGTIYNGFATNLTLAGTGFLSANLVVNFTPSGGSTTNVTVTPSSDTAATVAVPSGIYGQSTGTVIGVNVTNSDGTTSPTVNKSVVAAPTGGIIINDGNERTHIFKSTANFVVPTGASLSNVDFVAVAGGGGGGGSYRGGGGGAGGIKTSVTGQPTASNGGSTQSKLTFNAGTYAMTVGAGGAGALNYYGNKGSNSTIGSLVTVEGGGRGGYYTGANQGGAGGSGGGSGGFGPTTPAGVGGAGTSGQGNNGGQGSGDGAVQCGGGGGGAGAVGFNGAGGTAGTRGDGGVGITSNIISTSEASTNSVGHVSGGNVYFAGGGGAGSYDGGNNVAQGGLGGGAVGQYNYTSSTVGNAADTNTGGGGGGSSGSNNATATGGAGGSGVIILRYTIA
jgi:hypothetical protein